MKQFNINSPLFRFLALCFGVVVLYIFLPKRLTGLDDSVYLELANHLFKHKSTLVEPPNIAHLTGNIFSFRIFWLFCVWLGIQVFGTTIWAVSLPSLLATLGTAFLVYRLTANHKLYAVFFFLFCPVIFEFAFAGTPDALLMFFFALAYYVVFRQQQLKGSFWFNALLLGSALFLGFLVKELIVFIIPLLLFQAFTDLFKRKNIKFWFTGLVVSTLLFGAYLFYFKLTTGSFFYRFEVFNNNQYTSFCSYDILPKIEVFKRITLGIPFLIISSLSISLILPLILIKRSAKIPQILIHLIILLLTINFASIKLSSYSPMCLEMRHYLFVFPIACILIGNSIDFGRDKTKIIIVYLFALVLLLFALYLKYQLKKDYDVAPIAVLFYLIPPLALLIFKNKRTLQLIIFSTFLFFSVYNYLKNSQFTPITSEAKLTTDR